jgi:hypothetical protein
VDFANLLTGSGFHLRDIAIMLHQPSGAGQRAALVSLVNDAPELFDLYQDNHPKGPEATLKTRKYAASFVVNDIGEARFVGLYRVNGWVHQSYAALAVDPLRGELAFRISGEGSSQFETCGTEGRAVFDLVPMTELATLKGRLVVPRPAGRAYVRLAENCPLPITRIEDTARFIPPLPHWNALILSAQAVRSIPLVWAERISQWRGVYHILDKSDGARYVGSAYGEENLLGRWQAHVKRDRGVTAQLSKRDPSNFVFSVLELLAPSATSEEVLLAEGSWKERLGTRIWGLNQN